MSQLAQREHDRAQLQFDHSAEPFERKLCDSLTTRAGPFVGLRYPSRSAVGSALIPKLLGSYEQELHPIVNRFISRNYDAVYDVGCAEGYYAVGLARLLPSARVFAYDVVAEARELCTAMAALNDVADRVDVRNRCDPTELQAIRAGRALILCDCEGYERDLFNPVTAQAVARHDLLIEVHDFIRPFTSHYLRQTFAATHRVEVVRSVPDMLRPTVYPQAELGRLSNDAQIALMSELRPAAMTWFWLTPHDRPDPHE